MQPLCTSLLGTCCPGDVGAGARCECDRTRSPHRAGECVPCVMVERQGVCLDACWGEDDSP